MNQQASGGLVTRVFKSSGGVAVGSGIAKISLISVEFFLAAMLGAAGYGLFSIAFSLLLVVSTLALAGMGLAIVQYLGIYTENDDDDAQRSVVRVSLVFAVVVAGAIGAGLNLGADWLAIRVFDKPGLAGLLALVGLIIPFESLNQCLSAIFRGLRLYRYHVLVLDLVRNVSMLACFPFAFAGVLELEWVLYIVMAGTAAGTLIGLGALFSRLNFLKGLDRDWEIFRQLLSFSYLLFLWQALQKSANRLMLLVAGIFLMSSDVGILAIGLRFLNMLGFPQTVMSSTSAVEFARLNHRQDVAGINRLLQAVALVLLVVSLALSFPFLLNANTVMGVFGAEYAPYGWILAPLLIAKIVEVGTGPAGHVLVACRKRKTVLSISVADAGLQFLFVVPLIMLLGLAGAVYGNALRKLVIIGLRHFALYRFLGIYAITPLMIRVLGCALLAGLGGIILINLMDRLIWDMALTGTAMFMAGVLVTWMMWGDRTLGRLLLFNLVNRLRRSRFHPTNTIS